MDIQIKELDEIKEEIKALRELLVKPTLTKEWYNDKECWEMKGGCSLATYRGRRYFQCKGGVPDGYVGGRKVWSKASVAEWLPLTDDDLAEYHARYKTGVKRY